jgi:Cu+-exporting ATPase
MVVLSSDEERATIQLAVTGMHCASCVDRIERFLGKSIGVKSATVNLATNTATITYDPMIASRDSLVATVVKSGYGASAIDDASNGRPIAKESDFEFPNLLMAIILTIPIIVVSMTLVNPSHVVAWIIAISSAIVVFFAGREFFIGAGSALLHGGSATMDTLIAVGSFSAYAFSFYELLCVSPPHLYFETAATIVTLILIGRRMERRARTSAAESMQSLSSLLPSVASRVHDDGSETEIPISSLLPGDRLRVHPGEKLPADGVIVSGSSAVNESVITGESMPVEKLAGSRVIGGSINSGGTFVYRVTASGSSTILASIIKMVQEAQGSKANIQRIADKVSAVFVPSVFAIAALTFAIRLFLLHDSISAALIPAVAVLVVACPCALGLATPTAIMVSSARAAKLGILIKNGPVLERAQGITTVVFDKTGTLTEGNIVLTDVLLLGDIDHDKALALALSAETGSEHPLAKAIVNYAKGQEIVAEQASTFAGKSGLGVDAEVGGHSVLLGNEKMLTTAGIEIDKAAEAAMSKLSEKGSTAVFMAVDHRPAAVFGFADSVRHDAKAAIAGLKSRGIEVVMLTGDQAGPAGAIARSLGIDKYLSSQLPGGKADSLKAMSDFPGTVIAMVGDGVNDAPALAAADIGFAVGSATDITLNAADITIVRSDLGSIQTAIDLSKKTMTIIRQNLAWAFVFNIVGIPLAACGMLNPMIAAFAMAFSSTAVVTNSLRLRKVNLSGTQD